ncbi:MAG: cation transporter [Phycisphaerales bacterium]|nr:MAG: cation transporter [Phycisphaerales bacterium]
MNSHRIESASLAPAQTPPTVSALRRRAVILCVATTSAVAAVEIAIGVLFGLISVTAEGLHTLADLADSLVALVLVSLASRPADRTYPYGHGKFDALASIIEGVFVSAAAVWAVVASGRILLGLAEAQPRPELVTIVAMGVSSVLYLVVSTYALRLADTTKSPAVRAEALHLRSHVYITAALLVGLALSNVGIRLAWAHADRIDSLIALILGGYLLALGLNICKPGFEQLMDRGVSPDNLDDMLVCLREFASEYVEIQGIRARVAGTERHVDFHLVVKPDSSVLDAHDLSHRIEDRLLRRCPGIRLLVHIEPAGHEQLQAWERRGRTGTVVVSDVHPLANEASHHRYPRAHEV